MPAIGARPLASHAAETAAAATPATSALRRTGSTRAARQTAGNTPRNAAPLPCKPISAAALTTEMTSTASCAAGPARVSHIAAMVAPQNTSRLLLLHGLRAHLADHDEDTAQPVTQALLLPLYFISGIFVTVTILPHWLADVGEIFPVRHLASALLIAYNPAHHRARVRLARIC